MRNKASFLKNNKQGKVDSISIGAQFILSCFNGWSGKSVRLLSNTILSIFLILGPNHDTCIAQTNYKLESKAKAELSDRGISERELTLKLAEKGIDINNLQYLSTEQALEMQDAIQSAIGEIEEEKRSTNKRKSAPSAIDLNSITSSNANHKQEHSKTNQNNAAVIQDTTKQDENSEFYDSVSIWGQHLFRSKNLKVFQSAYDIKPPQSYVLGVGDKITISIWGLSQLNEIFEINNDGYITPARMPRIFLKGTTLGRAHSILNNYFRRFYRFEKNQFEIALNFSRTINVNIFGEVYQYGGFTMPAINTAFNAIVASGGPTNIGSVRRIRLLRNGKTKILDVYKFMMDPASGKDYYLENNDVIQIPVAEKVVSIQGAVKRPFRYELLNNEDLNHLIAYAGGLNENAIIKTIQIERFQGDRKLILDVPYEDLKAKGGDFILRNGDQINVFSIRTAAEEYVYVSGEVRVESGYQYKKGMMLSDLLSKIEFTRESNKNISFIKRKNADQSMSLIRVNLTEVENNIPSADQSMQAGDELIIYKQSVFADAEYISINGAIRQGGKFNYTARNDIRIKDLVLLAGGLKDDAFQHALLYRSKLNNKKDFEIIRMNIQEIMDNEVSEYNIHLQAFDSLVVLSQSSFDELAFVEISGAIRSPGRYAFGKGMNIQDLITLANGYTYFAATNKIDVFRVIIKNNEPTKTIIKSITSNLDFESTSSDASFELEPYDVIIVRSQPEFKFQQMVQIEGDVIFPGPYALLSPNEKISDLIKRAGGLTAEAFPDGATLYRSKDSIGYVVFDMLEALRKSNSRSNIILKEGDYIFIPKQKDLVRIAGATNAQELYPDKMLSNNNTITVAYHQGKSAKYYVDEYAAGISKTGDADKITVEHPNGRIDRTRRFLFFKIYPKVSKGSVVNVGYKEVKKPKVSGEKKNVDWGKVVADSIAQATAILSLILLIDRLN